MYGLRILVVIQVNTIRYKGGNGCKSPKFICGHSYFEVMFDKNTIYYIWCLRKSGFHQVRTMLRFVIEGKIKDLEIIEIEKRV
jgi:hypothetical protein